MLAVSIWKTILAVWLLTMFPFALLVGAFFAEGPFGKRGGDDE